MPPKKPIAKPKPVPRRGAAAVKPPADNAVTASASAGGAPNFTSPMAPMVGVSAAAEATAETTVGVKESKPIAPPKGRLDSLSSASSSRGVSGTRGGSSKLKFQPKVVQRRTKEERDNLDSKFQAEQEAAAAAAAAADRPHGRSSRGARGGGERGRGRGRGRGRAGGGGLDVPLGASGPFALGSIITTGRYKVMAERGHSFSKPSSRSFNYSALRIKAEAFGIGGVGGEGEGGEDSKMVVVEDYSSSDESDGQRMDVEYISLLDDNPSEDEGDRIMVTDWGAGAPIRIPRSEHMDRQVLVNTDSSLRRGKAELKAIKEKEMTFETDIKIKEEPEDDGDAMLPPSSPELSKRKVKVSGSPERKKKHPPNESLKKPRNKKKPIVSTTEEKEELERIESDNMYTLRELGGVLPDIKEKGKDADGDVDMLGPTAPALGNTETENQIFFFQFPPLLPHLVSTSATKQEPKTEEPDVKPEASTAAAPKKSILKGKALLKSQLALLAGAPPPGLVGKLRVHRSGSVSMLWGSPDEESKGVFKMEVNRGAPCEFLQEIVVIKEQSPYGDQDVDDKGRPNGVAYSLGQVKAKYVVSPEFVGLIEASNTRKSKGKGKTVETVVED